MTMCRGDFPSNICFVICLDLFPCQFLRSPVWSISRIDRPPFVDRLDTSSVRNPEFEAAGYYSVR